MRQSPPGKYYFFGGHFFCACGKPFSKIVPMAKLDKPKKNRLLYITSKSSLKTPQPEWHKHKSSSLLTFLFIFLPVMYKKNYTKENGWKIKARKVFNSR